MTRPTSPVPSGAQLRVAAVALRTLASERYPDPSDATAREELEVVAAWLERIATHGRRRGGAR